MTNIGQQSEVGERPERSMKAKAALRTELQVDRRLKPFYTGGRIHISTEKQLAACPCGEEVNVVDLNTGEVLSTVPGDTETVSSVAISRNGNQVFVSSRSLQCSHWDVTSMTCVRRWRAHQAPVLHMAIDAQDLYLATGGADRVVKVWDVTEGYLTHQFKGHSGTVLCVLFHHNPRRYHLYSSGDDGEVRIWDLKKKVCLGMLKAHVSATTSLSLSPCGRFLISGGQDNLVHMWNVESQKKVSSLPVNEVTHTVAFLASQDMLKDVDGDRSISERPMFLFITAGQAGKIKLWNAKRLSCEYEHQIDDTCEAEGGCLQVIALDSNRIVCVTVDCRVLTYLFKDTLSTLSSNLQAARTSAFWGKQLSHSRQFIGNNEQITDVSFLDSSRLVVGTNSQYIRIYDSSTFDCLSSCSGHTDIVLALKAKCIKPNEYLIASGGKDHVLLLWGCSGNQPPECLGKGEGHFSAIECIAFSQKSTQNICTGDADGFLKLWDSAWATTASHKKDVHSMNTVSTTAAHEKDVNTVAFSPDDSLLCSGSQDKLAKLWSIPSLAPVLTLRGHKRGVWSVSFSPIDKVIVTSSGDKTLRLWSISDGSCLRSFEGHTSSVLKVDFMSLGVQLISAGADGLIKIWNVRTSECMNTFDEHEDKIWAMSAVEEGDWIATGAGNGEVFVWKDFTEEKALQDKKDETDLIMKEQKVQDAIYRENYSSAFRIALDLKYPAQLHKVITLAHEKDIDKPKFWGEVVSNLSDEDLKQCLQYAAEWNTNSKFYMCGQLLLQSIFSQVHPDRLTSIDGLAETWHGLQAYSERHSKRIKTLIQSTYLLDYALSSASVPQQREM